MSIQIKKHPKAKSLAATSYRYVPIMETLENEELGRYVTYAISVQNADGEIGRVSDVSTDPEEVRELANICTEQDLDPEQLLDIIEDFLGRENIIP